VAALFFARNEHSRFISPTKTPEYLAAGKPVVSTSIRDVVRPYGEMGLVHIADDVAEFIKAASAAGMDDHSADEGWLKRVDEFLATNSWDKTWQKMAGLIGEAVAASRRAARPKAAAARAVSAPKPAPVAARAASASGYTTAAD
jgi:UDP-galactopyranose mutase